MRILLEILCFFKGNLNKIRLNVFFFFQIFVFYATEKHYLKLDLI